MGRLKPPCIHCPVRFRSFFDYISLCRVPAIQCCPHLTGKGHSFVLSPGHTISCICRKDGIRIQFYGAKNLSLLWSVPHGFYPVVSFTGCDVFGIRLATHGHDGLLMHTWTSQCTEKSCFETTLSQSPHVRVESLFNELFVECHLAQRQCVHACDTLRVVSLSPFEHHCDRVLLMTQWVCRWKPFGIG